MTRRRLLRVIASCEAQAAFSPALHATSRRFFQRGVNFTSEGPRGYSAEVAKPMLQELAKYGVDAIALVPYAFSPKDVPEVRFGGGWESDVGIEQVAGVAHQLGMKVLLKPQVWVRSGSPGSIGFTSSAALIQWFQQYRMYVEHQAGLATKIHADLFCVGVEFSQLTRYEEQWRRLISRVRGIYRGPLVYGATQGPEFESIQFWDALDYIGLNDYYALPDDLNTDAVIECVKAVQARFRKPVILPEVGFCSYENPQREPWDESPRRLSPSDQARCYEAVFRAFYRQPWFSGMYWWKIGTNGYGGVQDGSHTPWRKPAMEVVRKWYHAGSR
ncbi:MAG: glycoside hydrolase family 113 [Bryobacteraceae bacterium]